MDLDPTDLLRKRQKRSEDDTPKAFQRIMNHMKASKEKSEISKTDKDVKPTISQEPEMKIQPNESLKDFSHRVDRESAHKIAVAAQKGSLAKQRRKEK
jgi:hypothetical protein